MEGDLNNDLYLARLVISIHALRVEGDWFRQAGRKAPWYFYPRPPGGGRPAAEEATAKKDKISIHALRVEGDALGTTVQLRL